MSDKYMIKAGTIPQEKPAYSINIHADKKGVGISKNLFGIFFEDINYALDGGMYPELVQNKSFEFRKFKDIHTQEYKGGLYAWYPVEDGETVYEIGEASPIHENNPHYLKIQGAGIYNTGFSDNNTGDPAPGMYVKGNEEYTFSAFVRSADYSAPITARLTTSDGGRVLAECRVEGVSESWSRLSTVMIPNETCETARLEIRLHGKGVLFIDMVSLFPKKTWRGRENGIRPDIGELLAAMKPGFLRFPGGCVVEGLTIKNRYRWKETVGPLETRKNSYCNWGYRKEVPYYNQSYGFGFYEFFCLAEDLGAEAVPCINAGCSHADTLTPIEEMDEIIQDAVDLGDFMNSSDENNEWARLRMNMGHTEPFNVKYMELGNENVGDTYYERYSMIADAMRKYHPEIKLITGGGLRMNDEHNLATWDKLQKRELDADLVDDHYYVDNAKFYSSMNLYDNYDRSLPKVFVGEYASHGKGNNISDALAEAAFMTHLEENGDVVELASYAPLFSKRNFTQWSPDLLYFTNTTVYGSVNYYVQKLFMTNKGSETIPSEIVKRGDAPRRISGDVFFGNKENVVYSDLKTAQTDGGMSVSFNARKTGVEGGFVICFGDEKNHIRFDIGGWENTKSGVQRCVDGELTIMTPYFDTVKCPRVERDRVYEIKINAEGNRVKLYVDGAEIFNIVDRYKCGPVFCVASRDGETGEIIIKAVNPNDAAMPVSVKIAGEKLTGAGVITVLKGECADSRNSFEAPENVVPETTELEITDANDFSLMLEPFSLTILRIN